MAKAWHDEFLGDLSREGHVTIQTMVERYGISASTARRHIISLAENGKVKRINGGALYLKEHMSLRPFHSRAQHSSAAKRQLGAFAAKQVTAGTSVLIDGGTTTYEVARNLVGRGARVITNSMPVMELFARDSSTEVIGLGGLLYHNGSMFYGPATLAQLGEIRAEIGFLSTGGITHDGFFNGMPLIADLQRAMAEVCGRVAIVADADKWGRSALCRVFPLATVDVLVTDQDLPDVDPEELTVVTPESGLGLGV